MIFMGAVGRCFECEQPGAGLFTRCLRLRRWQHGRSQYAIRRCYFATWHARSIENPPAKTRTRAAGSACLALPAQKYSEKSRKFMYQRAQGARDQRAHVLLAAYRSLTPTHPSPVVFRGLDEERGVRGGAHNSDSRDNLYQPTTRGVTRDARIQMRMYIGRIGRE